MTDEKKYCAYLDEVFEGIHPDALFEDYEYLTTEGRANGSVSEEELRYAIVGGCLSGIIKTHDPARFNLGLNEYLSSLPDETDEEDDSWESDPLDEF